MERAIDSPGSEREELQKASESCKDLQMDADLFPEHGEALSTTRDIRHER